MIPEQAIEMAIEGGWRPSGPFGTNPKLKLVTEKVAWWTLENAADQGQWLSEIALDPSFWQALGKALGWPKARYQNAHEEALQFARVLLTGGDAGKFWEEVLTSSS